MFALPEGAGHFSSSLGRRRDRRPGRGLLAVLVGGDEPVSEERMAALEARVGQIAAGHARQPRLGVFAEMRRNLGTLSDRLDADEARLTALEKTPRPQPPRADAGQAPQDAGGAARRLDADCGGGRAACGRASPSWKQAARAAKSRRPVETSRRNCAARVAALDADIARFAETQKGTMDAVNARLAKIEAALPDDLAARLETLATKATRRGGARLARLEAANTGDTLHRAAAILALADLAARPATGRPFAIELDALAAAAPGDPALARAQALWPRPACRRLAQLRARFPDAARGALEVAHRTASPISSPGCGPTSRA